MFSNGEDVQLSAQHVDFGTSFWFHWSYLAQRALSGIALMGEIKLIYALRHCNLKISSKHRDIESFY